MLKRLIMPVVVLGLATGAIAQDVGSGSTNSNSAPSSGSGASDGNAAGSTGTSNGSSGVGGSATESPTEGLSAPPCNSGKAPVTSDTKDQKPQNEGSRIGSC